MEEGKFSGSSVPISSRLLKEAYLIIFQNNCGSNLSCDTKLGPFVQLLNRLFSDSQISDLKKYIGGVAYWPNGHRFNIKLGADRSLGSTSVESWQVVLQALSFDNSTECTERKCLFPCFPWRFF
jgi:hypothetical protein